jgi:hypothetical protein
VNPIHVSEVQSALELYVNRDVYLHLETTNGAYANLRDANQMAVSAYIRNGLVRFERASIQGTGPYRVGLKMNNGWIYAQGLTDWEVTDENQLLLAGHDPKGRLAVSLELSFTPFPV